MSQRRGNAEQPLATAVRKLLLDGLSSPEARWRRQALTQNGWHVSIAGGGCVAVRCIEDTVDQRRALCNQVLETLRNHYLDTAVELQGSKWKVVVESREMTGEWPKVHVKLHWISFL